MAAVRAEAGAGPAAAWAGPGTDVGESFAVTVGSSVEPAESTDWADSRPDVGEAEVVAAAVKVPAGVAVAVTTARPLIVPVVGVRLAPELEEPD